MTLIIHIFAIATLVGLATLATLVYFDRRNVPKGYDEECSKIDDELNEQGK